MGRLERESAEVSGRDLMLKKRIDVIQELLNEVREERANLPQGYEAGRSMPFSDIELWLLRKLEKSRVGDSDRHE